MKLKLINSSRFSNCACYLDVTLILIDYYLFASKKYIFGQHLHLPDFDI